MFKVKSFMSSILESKCRHFSIWNICPVTRWHQLWKLVGSCTPCRYEFFPFIFWLVLGLSFLGAYRSLVECAHIYYICGYPLEMWRPRKFYVLGEEVLRKARLVGAIMMSYAWLMMIYALVTIKPAFITPWLLINTLMLGMEFLFWLIEVLTSRLTLHLSAVFPMLRLFCALALVNCIKTVFENAVKHNMVDTLSVFGRESILGF